MGASPQFTEAMILGYIADHAGSRYSASALALVFGVSTASIRETLENLLRLERIRKSSTGKGIVYYIPDAKQKALESNAHRARPFKPLSAGNLPCLDYERRRAGSADMLKVPSKFHD